MNIRGLKAFRSISPHHNQLIESSIKEEMNKSIFRSSYIARAQKGINKIRKINISEHTSTKDHT